MDDAASILQGVALPQEDDEAPASSTLRGFANPELLEKAQATRASNRAAREPSDLLPGGEPAVKRGGRPKKSDRNLQGVEQLLSSIHLMLALATGFDDLKLDQTEAHLLAEATANLADHYKIKLDGKSGAIMGMIYAAGAVYGPRAVSIGIKLRNRNRTPGNVT
jgi:hypothetical protein